MIYVIGICGEIPEKILTQVMTSNLLIATDRLLQYFPGYGGEIWPLENIRSLLNALQSYVQIHPDHSIAILTSGDPLFYGLGRILLEHFPSQSLQFQPAVSSVQLAFNRLGIPWQNAVVVSIHGRSIANLIEALKQNPPHIAVLTDRNYNPAAIAALVEGMKLPLSYECWVCENLGFDTEQISLFDPHSSSVFSELVVVVLSRVPDPPPTNLPMLGIADRYFASYPDQPGLMTKQEIRVLTLGALQLQPDQIIWDIGAGGGSVAIEIARLVPSSQVFAIEKNAIGITLLQKNCAQFGTTNITIVPGEAPQILKHLPNPHRIFLGGSGGALVEILSICHKQILPQGILVANFASPEHATIATQWFKEQSISCYTSFIQLSRSVPLGKVSRYVPLTPISQVIAQF